MSKSISQLKKQWDKESESYTVQEIGSGVQRFVKEVLKSDEIFGLSEGDLATKDLLRENEFLEEKPKKNKRADVIIFINSDIVIPIEVERFGNINAGEKQLFEYQHVWDKKYGVLTDGYEWRFYNNKLRLKTFTLKNIFEETDAFVEFWKEYIQPKNYYLQFFEKLGQLELIVDDVSVGNNIQSFFQDITTLIRSFQYKLGIKGYFETVEGKGKAQKLATEITYAYIIQFILYKTLVDNDFADFRNDFDGRLKRIHGDLNTENYGDILNTIRAISIGISKNIYRPFTREQEYINKTIENMLLKSTNQLGDVTPWLDIFVFVKRYSFANVRNEIFGYIYENYLKDLYEEEEKRGQYFTDPAVVNFMLEQVGYTAEEVKNKVKAKELDKISLVDPACGSGTFLYSATNEIVKSFSIITNETSKQIEEIITSNIFGLDIEEFPLYLAEMSILMRILPLIMGEKYNNPIDKKIKVFWTQDSIMEFMGAEPITLGKQISFPDKIIEPKFNSFVRNKEDLSEMKESMQSIPRRRFDYVIANPPYISYNECSKQKLLVLDLLKQGMVKLNNIYGVNLHSIPDNPKRYAPKPNLYAFFIALGLSLLKDNAKLCYIIPQTVLVNSDLDVIRYHLAKSMTIERIITFSGKMFVGRGMKQEKEIPTSSLIFIVTNKLPDKNHKVEIINYKKKQNDIKVILENIREEKEISKKSILQLELLRNVINWTYIKQNKAFLEMLDEYKTNTDNLSIYYEHTKAMVHFGEKFYFDKGLVFPKKSIHKSKAFSSNEFSLVRLEDGRYTVTLQDTAVNSQDIRIPQGSQGLEVYRKRYKIVWSYMNFHHFYFSSDQIVLPYNFVIISSDSKKGILYLFSLLNSRLQKIVIEKCFKLEQEDKLTILLGIKLIKNQIRAPQITGNNQFIKDEIIDLTEEMLALEDKTLADLVDFTGIMIQKFDDVQVVSNTLVLVHDNRETKLPIQGDTGFIASAIEEQFGTKGLKLEHRKISLSELRNMQVIDFEKQGKIKDYIDDLVFALYFNITLKTLGLDNATDIKQSCMTNKYYKTISSK